MLPSRESSAVGADTEAVSLRSTGTYRLSDVDLFRAAMIVVPRRTCNAADPGGSVRVLLNTPPPKNKRERATRKSTRKKGPMTGWFYLAVLVSATAGAGAALHRWGHYPWYPALMGGVFVGVLTLAGGGWIRQASSDLRRMWVEIRRGRER